jgi:SAM-dependent methyltransferase
VSTSARCLGTADLENKPRERSRGTEQQAPWSRFPGVVTTPACNTADVRSYFDQSASTGSPEQHGHPQRRLEYRLALVRSLARPQATDVVLDLGCGNGHHLLALGPEVARGIGIDVSPGMIELARARHRSSPWRANLAFEVDDAEELEGIADQSIDLAICIGAFEHMLDKPAVLASIYRVLKFGGRFFCLAPDALRLVSDHGPSVGLCHQAPFQRSNADSRRIFRAARASRVSPHSVCSLDVHSQGRHARARCITAHGIRCNRATRSIGFSAGRPLIMRLERGEIRLATRVDP